MKKVLTVIISIVSLLFSTYIERKAQRRRLVVRWSDLLAICFESLVERNGALRSMSVKSEGEEDLAWHPLTHKTRHVREPELPVVIRMPHETAALSLQVSKPRKPFLYQSFANALPLVLRQH